jgi:asparaginyl-tRNA synthetase
VADEVLENYEEISKLTTGASVSISGKVVESPAKGQAFEIHAEEVRVIGASSGDLYPLQKKGHTLEFLREIAHLRPRTNTLGAVFRLRNTLSWAIHSFFQERDFLYVQTPIITANDAEGAGEMFHVTALDLENLPKNSEGKVDYSKDFFGTDVRLTFPGTSSEVLHWPSPMFYFWSHFRAENPILSRHLAEFWMIEPEWLLQICWDAGIDGGVSKIVIGCLP